MSTLLIELKATVALLDSLKDRLGPDVRGAVEKQVVDARKAIEDEENKERS